MSSAAWKRPEDILQIQRMKRKQKALQERLNRPSSAGVGQQHGNVRDGSAEPGNPFEGNQKRKNPFAKSDDTEAKRHKTVDPQWTTEDSVFELLSKEQPRPNAPVQLETPLSCKKPEVALQAQQTTEHAEPPKTSKVPPIHWSIKSKLRLISPTPIPGNTLKTNQEASGLTSFVRCIDPKESTTGLDISPGARFYQATLYWQHPYLPWLTLYPRNSRANNGQTALDETMRTALAKEWVTSFRNLFQLLRARQCPYFYVCANSFTVLFRAAGIGGRVETHALLTPTSRGMRSALRQEEIEFTMPLKKSSANQTSGVAQQEINRSAESGIGMHNSSFSNSSEEQSQHPTDEDAGEEQNDDDDDDDEDEMSEEKWLESLGVAADEIRKISDNQARKQQSLECTEDYSEQSTVLIEGADCQAFFNFLLNAKSTTARVGRLAGVPPTLLAPVAYVGATLRTLQTRSSRIRMEGTDYHSTELQGVILPHVLPYVVDLLSESKDNFSATMASVSGTAALCSVSQKLIDDADKENDRTSLADPVFGKENLSDCGLNTRIVESMCRATKDSVFDLERLLYSKEAGGYSWS